MKDPSGDASVQAWVTNPIGTAFYTGSLGTIAAIAQLNGRPAQRTIRRDPGRARFSLLVDP